MRRRNTPGAYFFSHGRRFARSIPSMNIFAKETCFQGAFLLKTFMKVLFEELHYT